MRLSDAYLIAGVAGVLVLTVAAFFKELRLISFDPDFAAAAGWPVQRLDLLANGLLLATVVVGLTSVGLILIVAMLIIPAVTARLWTQKLDRMALLAAILGGVSAYTGAAASAAFHHLPTGATIVLAAGVLFALSLPFAPLSRPRRAPQVLEPPA
jgi:manganese/zinc/iron transport system permease protein